MMESVLFDLSGTSRMKSSGCASSLLLSVKLSYLILSNACTIPKGSTNPIRLPSKNICIKLSIKENWCTHIGWIADQLSEEYLFVRVESVDDETEKLINFRLESECLSLAHLHVSHCLRTRKYYEDESRYNVEQSKRRMGRIKMECLREIEFAGRRLLALTNGEKEQGNFIGGSGELGSRFFHSEFNVEGILETSRSAPCFRGVGFFIIFFRKLRTWTGVFFKEFLSLISLSLFLERKKNNFI